tara:strand:- start:48 stop:800 length:753 start_codon:yes stop_codon:yes gene_type:complete
MSESNLVRINKVLRELNISLEVAVEFLQSNGHEIKKRPTTKVTLEHYLLLFKEFNSDKSNEFKTDEEIKKILSEKLQTRNQNKQKEGIKNEVELKTSKIVKNEPKLKNEGRTVKLYELLSKKSKAKKLEKEKNDAIEKKRKKKEYLIAKNKKRRSADYYKLLKLKRTFLKKDCNLIELCDYYFIKESWVLSKLLEHFPEVKMSDKVNLEHLRYISENLYETLCEVKKYSETIDSKNPKTKPNYYKLIYTR